ncbi:energy-coupling factor transporter transmembrane component T family protein [Mycoplasma buteonis]|uniref:energy-coupling factor transporter transmembrane component T family protein n=1 Tax=Mycoplasma buteonis TaxID=171280 RepID=UPI000565697D|nr:energy-coupling factor transporter transmembrane component T [Mycoplasma buteonis]
MNSIFGRFIPGKGFLYRLDPRLKLIMTICCIILVFFIPTFYGLTFLLLTLMISHIFVTKRPRSTLRMIKIPLFISIVLMVVNIYTLDLQTIIKLDYYPNYFWTLFSKSAPAFYQDKDKPLLEYAQKIYESHGLEWTHPEGKGQINYYVISLASLNRTVSLLFRIYIMILAMSLLTNTTRPILLTKSIEDILWPFKLLKMPVHIVAMIISIALRFIPTLLDEANRIMKAQTSRGVSFKHGSFKEKIIALTTLIIPLFVSSFAKAEDLSNSMETRGYDPYEKRTKYRLLSLNWIDFVMGFILILVVVGVALSSHFQGVYAESLPNFLLWFRII